MIFMFSTAWPEAPFNRLSIADMMTSGGTVFFPSGEYRITRELVVPTGVELRGVDEAPLALQGEHDSANAAKALESPDAVRRLAAKATSPIRLVK